MLQDTDTLAEQVIEQLGALAPPNLLLESIPEEVGGGGGSECEDEGYSEEVCWWLEKWMYGWLPVGEWVGGLLASILSFSGWM